MTSTVFKADHPVRTIALSASGPLLELLAYAHAWSGSQRPGERFTLSFSSMLAAMVAGPHDECTWFREHLALKGVPLHAVTRGQVYASAELPGEVWMSFSFNQARVEAEQLAGGGPLEVRHLMAAYAVVKDYHREDYLRLRIDRRAWCQGLAEHLAKVYPQEASRWDTYRKRAPAVRAPGFNADVPGGPDLLGIGREAEAFALLVTGTATPAPLSIGVFGSWGSGKSYFMARLQENVVRLAAAANRAHAIRQVRFNAWHYAESNVVASLIDEIARGLRGSGQLDEQLQGRQAAAREELTDAEAEESRAAQALRDAEAAHAQIRDQLAVARRRAPGAAAVAVLVGTLRDDPELARLEQALRDAERDARWVAGNLPAILLGAAILGLTALTVAFVSLARDLRIVAGAAGLVAAATPVVAGWVKALRRLAATGEAYRDSVRRQTEAAVAALGRSQGDIDQLASRLAAATAAVQEKRRALDAVTPAALLAELVDELATTDVYRKELGILAHARGHFERLAARVAQARAAGGPAAALDRIVVYVDDLDRCPQAKVKEVLDAVHLLLAFDLFVCVVAADPRWILHCLASSPGVVPAGNGDQDLAALGRSPTASDYLEKIIQIPLWLRPVPEAQRAPLVASLLVADQGAGSARIEIDPRELEFISRLSPMLDGNARALKRFANSYRLVKSSISDVELEYFVAGKGDPASGIPHRVCMAQLAVLATQRDRARTLVRLAEGVRDAPLREWLRTLATHGEQEVRDIARDLTSLLLPECAGMRIEHFATWLERTRRYSFYL